MGWLYTRAVVERPLDPTSACTEGEEEGGEVREYIGETGHGKETGKTTTMDGGSQAFFILYFC